MRFFAKVRVGSSIDDIWSARNVESGTVEGVLFSKSANGGYLSGELTSDDVKLLQKHPDVIVEAVTITYPRLVIANG